MSVEQLHLFDEALQPAWRTRAAHWLVERIREGRIPPAPVLRRWWANPDMPAPRVHRRGRPETGTCAKCGATFEMNPFGRPATKCAAHRRVTTPRQETP